MICSLGGATNTTPHFELANGVSHAGVLFLLPLLLSNGILLGKDLYSKTCKGFYDLVSIFLLSAFMALLRIKNAE